jgi:hypothetical protein
MADPQYYYSGQHGRFYFGNDVTPSGTVRDWQFASQMATLDATTLGDTYKVPVNGIRTLTGSATIFWSSGETASTINGTAHNVLSQMIKIRTGGSANPGHADEAGEELRLELRVDDGYQAGGKQGRGMELRVKITSIQMSMAHGEIFSANCSFESIGAPIEFSL